MLTFRVNNRAAVIHPGIAESVPSVSSVVHPIAVSKLKETRGKDPIHPNGAGYAIMAEAFLSRWAEIGANAK